MTSGNDVSVSNPHKDPYERFRDELFEAELLVDGGQPGLYLRSDRFERICHGIDDAVSRAGQGEASASYHFPLVMGSKILEQSDYVRSFPNLVGVVSSFADAEGQHGELLAALESDEEWGDLLRPTSLALCSAACHPLYRTQTGRLPVLGRIFELVGQCFRHEPSTDPAWMQVFRQHEFVFIGDPQGAREHRDRWVTRGLELHARLRLDVEPVVANDPFFGRNGRMLIANQRSEALKIELVSPICSVEEPTAITSANCHLDHFGLAFGIESADGAPAHSACVGFGVERIALALIATHGSDPTKWPNSVIDELRL